MPAPPLMVPHAKVLLVGTGFSGLGMAIRLSQQGDEDYVILEKADDVGGTWRDNRYPGCACDVPSRIYSFSFAQNPSWSRDFAPAGEIWQYLRDCTERYGIADRIVFGADLESLTYDETERHWLARTRDGRSWTAGAVVLGVGALHQPHLPDIAGLDTFEGPVLHSALWPADDGLTGKRVAVIGTGASAIQLVPAIASRAQQLHVFQRTAAWVMPKNDKVLSARRHAAYRSVPGLQRAVRWATYWQLESRVLGFTRLPQVMRLVQRASLKHLETSVADPKLRADLTPRYTIGCKRILISNDYWPTFNRDDVELVTDPITRVENDAVVTAGGTRRVVDAIVLGTGFTLDASFERIDIRGLGGRSIADSWSSGMQTNLGVTVAGHPELYLLLGPNTGLGHTSVVMMIEFATQYVLKCLERAEVAGAPQTGTGHAQGDFMAEIERRSKRTVWATGCRSWYLDRFGNNTFMWPGSTLGYWWRTRRVDPSHFESVVSRVRPG